MPINLAATVDGPALGLRPARVNIFERPDTPNDQAQTDPGNLQPLGCEAAGVASSGEPLAGTRMGREPRVALGALVRRVTCVGAAVVVVLFVASPTDPPRRGATPAARPV